MNSDWIIHTVIDDQTGRISGHTHGLEKLGGLEVEINLNLRPGILGQYLNLIADHIVNKGLQIEDGERVTKIFSCPIYFFRVKSVQSDDEVLSAIFPDEAGMYPWDTDCSPEYREQIVLKGKYKL
jgi:hypothetical protein